MNSLNHYLTGAGLDPVLAMDRLQEAGIVSDNAERANEVAECDCAKAIAYLKEHP